MVGKRTIVRILLLYSFHPWLLLFVANKNWLDIHRLASTVPSKLESRLTTTANSLTKEVATI